VIRLKGTVADRQMKRRAEECVESVYGVVDVMNETRVAPKDAAAGGAQERREPEAKPRAQRRAD
jgi:BON domain